MLSFLQLNMSCDKLLLLLQPHHPKHTLMEASLCLNRSLLPNWYVIPAAVESALSNGSETLLLFESTAHHQMKQSSLKFCRLNEATAVLVSNEVAAGVVSFQITVIVVNKKVTVPQTFL